MRYWVFLDNQVKGPFSPDELAETPDFSEDCLVCAEGSKGTALGDWRRASKIESLSSELAARRRALRTATATMEPAALPHEPTLKDLATLASVEERLSKLDSFLAHLREAFGISEEGASKIVDDLRRLAEAGAAEKLAILEGEIDALKGRLSAKEAEISKIREEMQPRGAGLDVPPGVVAPEPPSAQGLQAPLLASPGPDQGLAPAIGSIPSSAPQPAAPPFGDPPVLSAPPVLAPAAASPAAPPDVPLFAPEPALPAPAPALQAPSLETPPLEPPPLSNALPPTPAETPAMPDIFGGSPLSAPPGLGDPAAPAAAAPAAEPPPTKPAGPGLQAAMGPVDLAGPPSELASAPAAAEPSSKGGKPAAVKTSAVAQKAAKAPTNLVAKPVKKGSNPALAALLLAAIGGLGFLLYRDPSYLRRLLPFLGGSRPRASQAPAGMKLSAPRPSSVPASAAQPKATPLPAAPVVPAAFAGDPELAKARAIALVKSWPAPDGKRSLGQILEQLGSVRGAGMTSWLADAARGSSYEVDYYASVGAGPVVAYRFQADLAASTVKPLNQAAQALMNGRAKPAAVAIQPKRRPARRTTRRHRKAAQRPSNENMPAGKPAAPSLPGDAPSSSPSAPSLPGAASQGASTAPPLPGFGSPSSP
jgi:hypothetical protein